MLKITVELKAELQKKWSKEKKKSKSLGEVFTSLEKIVSEYYPSNTDFKQVQRLVYDFLGELEDD